ncbi:hypothetical protein [Allobaculum stercoricanis]|uniref:hypothetical protein n=1 Tax=Allobaculum stercoricanis TaxID=174709 RepID=UPI0023F246B9|nr:hypothetical protein [Allobaculum stercoricanis]
MMDTVAMKFELIYEITLDPDNPYTIQQLCTLNHVSRSGYYNWLLSKKEKFPIYGQNVFVF